MFDLKKPAELSQAIADQWSSRWAIGRGARADILAKIQMESLVYPVRHHARVVLPKGEAEQMEFLV